VAGSVAALLGGIPNGDGSKKEWRITTPRSLSIGSGYLMNNGCNETHFQTEDTTACSKLLLRHSPTVR